MDRGETVSEVAPRKLARQLDFTAVCRDSDNAASSEQLRRHALPSEQQPSSPLLLELQLRSGSEAEPELQPQPSLTLPCKSMQFHSQPAERPIPFELQIQQIKSPFLLPRIPYPVQKPLSPVAQDLKQDSPVSRTRFSDEVKDGTPKKQKRCNCKSSRCLKLYCECYAAGIYCEGCNCMNCQNNVENEAVRQEAIEAILGRNPNAFKPKIDSSPLRLRNHGDQVEAVQVVGKHNKGCQCKKTGCLKKYCECFQAGILCSDNCRCKDCRNYEGSEERTALHHVGPHTMTHVQQAANAAICGAIGSSGYGASALRRMSIFGATNDKFTQGNANIQQENNHNASAASLPVSAAGTANMLATRCPNYRSPLANILQLQDIKKLCSLLVVASTEVTKKKEDIFSGIEDEISKQAENYYLRARVATSTQRQDCNEKGACLPEEIAQYHFRRTQAQRDETSSSSSVVDDKWYERPTSPATLALLCDERDSFFLGEGLQNGMAYQLHSTSKSAYRDGPTEVYAEQEKCVLTNFRDFLSKLVSMSGGSTEDMALGTTLTIEAGDEGKQPNIEMRDGNKRDQPENPYPNGVGSFPAAATKESSSLVVMTDMALGTTFEVADEGKKLNIERRDVNKRRDPPEKSYPNGVSLLETNSSNLIADMALGTTWTVDAGDEGKRPSVEMRDGNRRRDQPEKPYYNGMISFPAAVTKETLSPDPHLKIGLSNGQMKSKIESMV
ncbi:hypothetical protein SAY86_027108 [Trapa natans]|uniref:CRC domain-containing protein n=1 Tax=Trapa natans TaxID=22666 RepID=A0AAN7KGX2_TRANT|nr:hypothetical protein SAY86_027108 [Trapa natans]